MTPLLMPKATAVWLVENTTLTFEQIADFCDMHPLEVQGIADGEVAISIIGQDPIAASQLTREEIERCEKDPKQKLELSAKAKELLATRSKKPKGSRYTPVARRQDKPDAIAWLIKHCPELTDAQISRLIGTTKNTINSIRNKTHWNWGNLTPRDPVLLGLCTQTDLDKVLKKAKAEAEKLAALEQKTANKENKTPAAKNTSKKAPNTAKPTLESTSDSKPENVEISAENTSANEENKAASE